ncbi:MAG: hypothetical protein PUG48_01130 [Clostridia bacterium]|nr:hypothetical protein [Clostridia bacterium]
MNKNTTNTIKKPYELKAEHNKDVLNTFFENSTADFKTLVDALLAFGNTNPDRATGSITVSIGNKVTDNCFTAMLISHTNKPVIMIGNWNNVEPTFCIKDSNYRTNNIVCSLNLTLINNLCVDKISDKKYIIDFKYDNSIDYQIDITYNR